jgi:hypothetical protein
MINKIIKKLIMLENFNKNITINISIWFIYTNKFKNWIVWTIIIFLVNKIIIIIFLVNIIFLKVAITMLLFQHSCYALLSQKSVWKERKKKKSEE